MDEEEYTAAELEEMDERGDLPDNLSSKKEEQDTPLDTFEMPGPYGDMISEAVEMSPEEQKQQAEDLSALPLGVADAITFGYADELAEKVAGPEARDKIRELQKDPNNQGLFVLGNIIGGIGMGGPIASGARYAKNLLGLAKVGQKSSSMLKGGAIGAGEGLTYGTGSSEKKFSEDAAGVFHDALVDTFLGLGGGALVGWLAKGYKPSPGKAKELVESKTIEDIQEHLGEDRVQNYLDKAQKRAAEDFEANKQIAEKIEEIASSDELKDMLDTSSRIKDKVAKFTEKYDYEAFLPKHDRAVMNKDLKKLFKSMGEEVQEENLDKFRAYANFRQDVLGYMRWLADSNKGRKTLDQVYEDLGKVSQKPFSYELKEAATQLDKSGMINPESYNLYKMQQNLADEIYTEHREKLAQAMIGKDARLEDELSQKIMQDIMLDDPVGKLGQKMQNAHVVAELVDAKAGTDMQDLIYKMSQARNLKTSWENNIRDVHRMAQKRRDQYPELKGEDIIELIESGAKHPVADAYRTLFKKIRLDANKKGLKIDEFTGGQNKYVPLKRKSGAPLIKAFEDRYKELRNLEGVDELKLDEALLVKSDIDLMESKMHRPDLNPKEAEALKEEIKAKTEDIKDALNDPAFQAVNEFRDALALQFPRKSISSVQSMKDAMKDIRSRQSRYNSADPDISAAYTRGDAHMPKWLRDNNLDGLVQKNLNDASSAIFYRPVLDQIDVRTSYLQAIGMEDMARYFNKYRNDIVGRKRDSSVFGLDALKDLADLAEIKLMDSEVGKLILGMKNYALSNLYPAYLGGNASSVVRNMLQIPTMTLPEMGYDNSATVLKNMGKTLREFLFNHKAFKAEQKRLADLGIITNRELRPEDMEGIARGLKEYFGEDNKTARIADKLIKGFNDKWMWAFSQSDAINRIATARAAEELVDKLFAGDKAAMRAMKRTPAGVQKQMNKALDAGLGKNAIKEILMKHYDTQTQLAYGDVDMHELGREMGPVFTMLTKWPITVAGDINKKLQLHGRDEGSKKIIYKYMLPWMALAAMDQPLDKDTPEYRALIGPSGLAGGAPILSPLGNPMQMLMPVPAIAGASDLVTSGVQAAQDALSGRNTRRSSKKFKKAADAASKQFVPIYGPLKVFSDRIDKIKGDK